MSQMNISNTLFNDTSTGELAYVEQLTDRLLKNYISTLSSTDKSRIAAKGTELGFVINDTTNEFQDKLNKFFLNHWVEYQRFLLDEGLDPDTIDSWKEIQDFLEGLPDDETMWLKNQLQRLDNRITAMDIPDGGAYDVSADHVDGGGNYATYADLSAALAAISTDDRKSGMSIRFINSTTNKYEQWRYMLEYANTTAGNTAFTTVSNWQGIDDEPTAGSNNLVKSGGVYRLINETKTNNYNISLYQLNTTAPQESSRYNTNIFTLEEAIAQVPNTFKHGGLNLTFNSESGVEVWSLVNQTWNTNVGYWKNNNDISIILNKNSYSTGGNTIGSSTLEELVSTDRYDSVLIEGKVGLSLKIAGKGGTNVRLWKVYDANKVLRRLAEETYDSRNNPVTITLEENSEYEERYILVQCSNAGYYRRVDMVSNPDKLFYLEVIDNLTTDDPNNPLSAKQGKLLKDNLDITNTKLNSLFKDLSNNVVWSNNKFLSVTGTLISTSSANGVGTLDLSELYSIIEFKYSISGGGNASHLSWAIFDDSDQIVLSGDTLLPSQALPPTSIIISLLPNYKTLKYSWNFQLTDTRKVLSNVDYELKINNLNNEISGLQSKVSNIEQEFTEDITSKETLNQNKFLLSNGHVAGTTTNNGVFSVDITGYKSLSFNYSSRGGGSISLQKVGWVILDSKENVVASAEVQASAAITNKVVECQENYKTLLISWNFDNSASLHYTKGNFSLEDFNTRIKTLENEETVESNHELNIENISLQSYMNNKYNNNDYGYTKIQYLTRGVNWRIPNSIKILTPVVENILSRTLEYADNSLYEDSKIITLDLVSDTYNLTNLLPNKLYYYRIYADDSIETILDNGYFYTKGNVRMLAIPANTVTYPYTYIANVRDLGGWRTDSGKSIRYGIMFRGNELNHLENDVLTSYVNSESLYVLKNILGINAELDLRGNIGSFDEGIDYIPNSIDLTFYRINIYRTFSTAITPIVNAIKALMSFMKKNKIVYTHCAGGCDRTGVFFAVIEGICGVSENDINHDYEISSRSRMREYYSISDGINGNPSNPTYYDGDFKYAMEYIKGILSYNNHLYTYCRSYVNSLIKVDSVEYTRRIDFANNIRGFKEVEEGGVTVRYYWYYNTTTQNSFYTKDKYPTTDSQLYEENQNVFSESSSEISEAIDKFYFDVEEEIHGNGIPNIVTDASLIANLENCEFGTLKERFRKIAKYGGMTDREIQELEYLICV